MRRLQLLIQLVRPFLVVSEALVSPPEIDPCVAGAGHVAHAGRELGGLRALPGAGLCKVDVCAVK